MGGRAGGEPSDGDEPSLGGALGDGGWALHVGGLQSQGEGEVVDVKLQGFKGSSC